MYSIKNILTLFCATLGLSAFSQCPTLTMSGSPVSCYAATDGQASVAINGTSGNYTITWSTTPTTTSSVLTSVGAGSYTVNVKDNVTGCTSVGVYVVNTPDPISIPSSTTDVNCFGESTGGIVINPFGGNMPYSYDWDIDGTGDFNDNKDINNLSAGNYTVVVRDSKGCQATKSLFINQPNAALNANLTQTNVSCFGETDGSVDLTTFGGSTPYSYAWSNTAVSQDLTNLSAGNYSVTITDNKGCTRTESTTINQPTQLSTTMGSTPVLCNGDSNGSVSVAVGGGSAPYSYQWKNSNFVLTTNSATLNNVVSDVYEVTVTDANGCTITDTETINTPTALISSITGTNVSCFGGNDGSVDVTVSGGTPNYTYTWQNSTGNLSNNTQDLSNLNASIYSVEINDNNGCTAIETIEITQPMSPVSISGTITNVDCYGTNTGAIDVVANGGTLPYAYNWSNGATTEDISNLIASSYNLSITDGNACSYSASFTVTQPNDTLSATNLVTPVNCFGESNGGIDMTPAGGTAPYFFNWSNSSFQLSDHSEDLLNYPADTYFLEMLDAKNCIHLDTIQILQPTALMNSLTDVDVLCKNDATGSIDQTINGGVTPYNIFWSNNQTTEDLSNLTADWYVVTVTDFNGCTTTDSTEITEPLDTIGYTFTKDDVICNNGNTGSISILISGGTTPYQYNWNTGDTLANIEDLTAGTYTFLITDNNGCNFTDSIEVTQPEPLVLNEIITDVTCFGLSDGSVDISPTGGTAPYTYTWLNSNFQLANQTQDLLNFPADIYQLELRDTFNCLTEVFIEIPEPDLLQTSLTSVDITCAGGTDGSIDVSVIGGNPGYTYLWTNGVTSQDLTDIPVGTYQVLVTDTKNCSDSIAVTLVEPDSIKIDFDIFNVSCADQQDGMLTALPYGGTGSFLFDWSSPVSQIDFIENLAGGTYAVTVTDIVGCTATDSATVLVNPILCLDPPNTFSPNNDGYNDVWNIQNIEIYPNAIVQIYNRWGNLLYEQKGSYTAWDGIINGQPLPAETYYYVIIANFKELEPLKGTLNIIR